MSMTLSDWMKLRDVTQGQLAGALGVSTATISRYCSGARRPEWDVMQRIYIHTQGQVTPNDFLFEPDAKTDCGVRAA